MTRGRSVVAQAARATALLALAAGLIGWAEVAPAVDSINDSNVEAAMVAAKTPADHEALAAYFTSKAEQAQANVEKHKRMSGLFGGKGKAAWEGHCRSLSRTYQEQVRDYTALAKEELAVAKALQAVVK